MSAIDPIALSQELIRRPSVTPEDKGALDVLAAALMGLGFTCHRLRFEEAGTPAIDNLYARIGTATPHFCFAGHTDVVPVGDEKSWQADPFGGEIRNGVLYGRGAADMKTAIAAFVAASGRQLSKGPLNGSISFLITGDEEGPAINGTRKMLGWLKERGETIDHCVVGEPTSTSRSGDTIKNGRRGSIGFAIAMRGTQGHVAYPHQANNPLPAMAALVAKLSSEALDRGNGNFDPSTLNFTTVDVGNAATNVIPAEARAYMNIRFNDLHTPASLKKHVEDAANAVAKQFGCQVEVIPTLSGESFVTQPGAFTDLMSNAIEKVTGLKPVLSTSGGTSDARFIKDHCAVAELGLPNATMHKVDECMPVSEIHLLADIYAAILDSYFVKPIAK